MKKFLKSLSSKELKIFVVLIAWFFVNLFLFLFNIENIGTNIGGFEYDNLGGFEDNSRYQTDVFIPFEGWDFVYYDFSELFIYGIVPFLCFFLYRYLNKIRTE